MNLLQRIPPRGYIAFGHDIVMAGLSFVVSLYLRFGDDFSYYTTGLLVQGTLAFMVIATAVFWYMDLYRGVWRYASMNDLLAITKSATLVILIFLVVMFLWTRLVELPRSSLVINWFVLMALLGGPRFLYRWLKDRRIDFHLEDPARPRIPVLLVGAGDGAELFIRSLARDGGGYQVVGIASETRGRVGRRIHGVEVLGTTDDLPAVVSKLEKQGRRPQRLILTKERMDGARIGALLGRAAELGMTLARLPRLTDFRQGAGDTLEVRPVAVEDLLGRPQKPLDREAMRAMVRNHRVLITGAGGSIGSELVRQVSDFAPSAITLLDHSEGALYTIDMETRDRHPELPRQSLIADVRDRARIQRIMSDIRPQLVFHAAALKHVPLVEENVFEGATTNVIGTVNMVDACRASGVATMVMISTDKAVNPTSVMGATKRVAEQYCQVRDLDGGGTRLVTVRFGNVLGSNGSVVPLFQRQLAAGGPLTVTHPDMIRYFMTIREAVELVLQASALRQGRHRQEGKIFVLDMGEPVAIQDLARQMIRLAGLKPDEDIKIEYIGLRPGEKLFEEMFHDRESMLPTDRPGILLAAPRTADRDQLDQAVADIAAAAADADARGVIGVLRRLVPEYTAPAEDAGRRQAI